MKTLLTRASRSRCICGTSTSENGSGSGLPRLRDRSAAKQIAVRSTPAAESWRLHPEALGRALDNLIDNALDYTPSGGSIGMG